MFHQVLRLGTHANKTLCLVLRRNIAASSVVLANDKMTPVQKLYLEKIKEYAKKSKAQGGDLVDPDPIIEKEISAEGARLHKMYGGGDLTQFPSFEFKEIDFESVDKK